MSVDRMDGDSFDLRVVQHGETGIRKEMAGHFRLRYLSVRSADSRRADAPGQDYIAVRQAGTRLVFALCDGVSESFYGELAARFLGDALVAWLWDSLASGALEEGISPLALHDYLSSLTAVATEQVQALPLPAGIPPALREVLEQKRAMGSEAVFVCGALELPSTPTHKGIAVFAWMGNAELQLLGREADSIQPLDAAWDDRQRWSTRSGPKGGLPRTFAGTMQHIQRILAYSDGIASLREALRHGLSDESLAAEVERLGQNPTSDDIAFLEIEVLYNPTSDIAPPLSSPAVATTAVAPANHSRQG